MAIESTPPPSANGVGHPPLSVFDVLTLSQAAVYLQLPEDTVRREAEADRLAGRRVDGEWRFVREAIVSWLRTPSPRSVPTWTPEREADAEAEIAAISARRRSLGTVGDLVADEAAE